MEDEHIEIIIKGGSIKAYIPAQVTLGEFLEVIALLEDILYILKRKLERLTKLQ